MTPSHPPKRFVTDIIQSIRIPLVLTTLLVLSACSDSETEENLADVKKALMEQFAQVQSLQNEIDAKQASLAEKDNAVLSLESTIREKDEIIDSLVLRVSGNQKQLDALQAQIDESAQEHEDAVVALRLHLLDEQALSESQAATIKALQDELRNESQKQSGSTDAEKALDQLHTENTTLTETIDQLQSQVDQLTDENRLLAENRAQLETKIQSLSQSDENSKELEELLSLANANLTRTTTALQQREQDVEKISAELNRIKESFNQERGKREVTISQLKDRSALLQLGGDLVFGLGSTRLTPQGKSVLDQVKALLETYPDYTIGLEGHTDNVAIRSENRSRFPNNWVLSTARAASAASYLREIGVDPSNMKVSGFGEYRPIASNDTEEGRSLNRRLEILLIPNLDVKPVQ